MAGQQCGLILWLQPGLFSKDLPTQVPFYRLLMKSFQMPITNNVAIKLTPIYPNTSIFVLLLLYYMK
jgi:hypothetical protein